ncbi:MAG: PEP-CTERM sorting domain-containing protein [Candidatus Electrothrix sp. GM3_4]|nr:PEP-CTERM sorting domain-containing protein [Candidatus Electrothrix sp. GM3_4]
MKKLTFSLALAAVFAAGTAQAIIIDDFNDGQQTIEANGSESIYAGAIGGSRSVSISKDGLLGATAHVLPSPWGIFSHSADAQTSAISIITWDANGLGLGGVDFVEGLTNNVFSFDILDIDQGAINLTLEVRDTLGGTNSYNIFNAAVGTESVAFSHFAGVDFTTIDFLSLTVAGGQGSDLTLDTLATSGSPASVPEPTALMLLGGGLLGLGGIRRKNKKTANS